MDGEGGGGVPSAVNASGREQPNVETKRKKKSDVDRVRGGGRRGVRVFEPQDFMLVMMDSIRSNRPRVVSLGNEEHWWGEGIVCEPWSPSARRRD